MADPKVKITTTPFGEKAPQLDKTSHATYSVEGTTTIDLENGWGVYEVSAKHSRGFAVKEEGSNAIRLFQNPKEYEDWATMKLADGQNQPVKRVHTEFTPDGNRSIIDFEFKGVTGTVQLTEKGSYKFTNREQPIMAEFLRTHQGTLETLHNWLADCRGELVAQLEEERHVSPKLDKTLSNYERAEMLPPSSRPDRNTARDNAIFAGAMLARA